MPSILRLVEHNASEHGVADYLTKPNLNPPPPQNQPPAPFFHTWRCKHSSCLSSPPPQLVPRCIAPHHDPPHPFARADLDVRACGRGVLSTVASMAICVFCRLPTKGLPCSSQDTKVSQQVRVVADYPACPSKRQITTLPTRIYPHLFFRNANKGIFPPPCWPSSYHLTE